MNKTKVVQAIEKARKGIAQYLEIMAMFPSVNAARDQAFQKKFNAFYRIRQRSARWYQAYFGFMQGCKGSKPCFNDVLDYFKLVLGRYEPSFSSKLVATLDPEQPIWDAFVLKNTFTKIPSYGCKNKFEQAKSAYASIKEWYKQLVLSDEGRNIIKVFNEAISEHASITNVKKIDFVLWQTRV